MPDHSTTTMKKIRTIRAERLVRAVSPALRMLRLSDPPAADELQRATATLVDAINAGRL